MNNENRLFKIPFNTFATLIVLLTTISGLLIIFAWQNNITFLTTLLLILIYFGILFTSFSGTTLKISINQKLFAGIIFASCLLILNS
jgi:hypothetical protein